VAPSSNRKIVLAKRPQGIPEPSCFRLEEESLAPLAPDQVRVDVSCLSIDAFIRTTLEEVAYHTPVAIGGTIIALGVGRVRESRSDRFEPGDAVMGPLGVQTIATLPSLMLQKIDDKRAPMAAYLGILGMTAGLTAYFGVREVGQVRAGETVVVSAAAGAVGSLAGQIARLDGARVIGIAGGPQKARFLTEELGFDAAIDYKGEDVDARLRELAPEGIDVYFDNVGGELLDVVLDQIRERARVVICGAISQYHGDMSRGVRGPSLYLRLAERHARMEGYAVNHFTSQFEAAEGELIRWLDEGALVLPEHVEDGIENFGTTLVKLFDGSHIGKLLLSV
jgi:NADPH-dependent curcumin reductase CurA